MSASLATSLRLRVSKLRPDASSTAAASISRCRVSSFCCFLVTFKIGVHVSRQTAPFCQGG